MSSAMSTPKRAAGVVAGLESVGDWQLARFKASATDGQILDRGLWRYTRHPNYFGDFCMWWGLFGVSLGSWRELPAIVGPLLMHRATFIPSSRRLVSRARADTGAGTSAPPATGSPRRSRSGRAAPLGR
jgi:protein-S-isoprenylcysteine O-methyltransferase Ste14